MFELRLLDPNPTGSLLRYQVNCPEAEAEMVAPFKHRPRGYQFRPAFQRGTWDGYTCPINRMNKTVPKGMARMVYEKFKDDPNWDLDVSQLPKDLLEDIETIPRAVLLDYFAALRPQRWDPGAQKFVDIGFHDHQVDMVYHGLNRKRLVAESATSSGKSLSMWGQAKYYLDRLNPNKQKVLIIVPSVGLVSQLASDFTEYSAGGAFRHEIRQICAGAKHDPDYKSELAVLKFEDGHTVILPAWEKVQMTSGPNQLAGQLVPRPGGPRAVTAQGKVVGGVTAYHTPKVVISTWQSLQKTERDWFDKMNFGMVMVEECQGAGAEKIGQILGRIDTADYRMGCTGTLHDHEQQAERLAVIANLGPPVPIIRTRELIDRGLATPIEVVALVLKYPKHVQKRFNSSVKKEGEDAGDKFRAEKEYLLEQCVERQMLIARLAVMCKSDTLVLSDRLDCLDMIEKYIRQVDPSKPVYKITGAVKKVDREEIRKSIGTGEPAVLLGSAQITSTGISIPSLGAIIGVNMGESMIRSMQTLGRGLRKSTGKEKCTYYAIADDLRRVSKNGSESPNYLWEHFLTQLNYFAAEDIPVRFKEIELKGDFKLPPEDKKTKAASDVAAAKSFSALFT